MQIKAPDFSNTQIAFASKSNAELYRAVSLFRIIHFRPLVATSGKLLTFAFNLRLPISWTVRWTVFNQFCGGETLEDCRASIQKLLEKNVTSILDYGVEGEKTEKGFESATKELIRTAVESSRTPGISFVVFKFTAIARFELMEKISANDLSSLTDSEKKEWQKVQHRVSAICDAALKAGRPVMVDAEETWIQGAIDHEVLEQMRSLNRESAKVFITIQAYRADSHARLKELHAKSKAEGWHLGIKLVRGAYMEKERVRADQKQYPSPIHPNKSATDLSYNQSLEYCLDHSENISICIGTHNEESTKIGALKALNNPEKLKSKVWFSQLLGMGDNLSFNLANAGLQVAKYVPYGPVHAVLPYLLRRADENSSVEGQSSRELQLLEQELKRRKESV